MSLRSKLIALLAGIISSYAAPMTWPSVATAGSCPNEEVRAEQGSDRLPDCRAFELVTPEVKGDNSSIGRAANGNPYGFPDGNHVYYASVIPLPGAQSGELAGNLSTRTPSGWVNTPLAGPATGPGEPQDPYTNHIACGGCYAGEAAFTTDFSAAFVDSGFDADPLDQDGVADAYRMDLSSGVWSLAALPDTGLLTTSLNAPGVAAGTYIAGVSENGSHVFFQSFDQLSTAPGTPSEPHPLDMLYDRTGGHTYAVGILPDGRISETCGVRLGDGAEDAGSTFYLIYGAISPDGTNVVFTERAKKEGETCGASQGVYLREHNGENNAKTVQLSGEAYLGRSSDASKIFTTSVGDEGVDEYDVGDATTTTISANGQFIASSADGSRVYYLVEGAGPEAGVYLWDRGTSTLIPKAGEGFANLLHFMPNNAGENFGYSPDFAVATPDGSKLLFLDTTNLTGYDSRGLSEAYVYDANSRSVTCVSCNPTGTPPLGSAHLMGQAQRNTILPNYSQGEISPDGSRVFFETSDALVPQDTNGLSDVYEWENGRIYLISSGQGTFGSDFSGASSDGHDVFITTTDRLAPQDIEHSVQVYDARVNGGFPYRPATTGCNSGQCQGPQTPAPVFGAPASATFVGLGNLGGREPNPPPVKPKSLTSTQKLAKALKACRSNHNKHDRLACEKRAHERYGHRSPSPRRPKS
jgi:hypothetical protein